MFWNLLTNAVKFTPKGGFVRVLMQRVNSHVEVSVTDSGQGMQPSFLAHAFEQFRQADSSETQRTNGLGLGLSIVKNLVEMHGGSIRAMSDGLGKGSTFLIDLPLTVVYPTHADAERVHPHATLTPTTKPMRARFCSGCWNQPGPACAWRSRLPRHYKASRPTHPTCWSATSACPAKTATR